jgi:hypothetical protein
MRGGAARWRLTVLAILLLAFIGYRVFSPAPAPLPVYVILSEESGFSPAQTSEILDLLRLDADDSHVHVIDEGDAAIISDLDDIQERLDAIGDDGHNGLMFVSLGAPTADNKKRLRASVVKASGDNGCQRMNSLARIVPIVTSELYAPNTGSACARDCTDLRDEDPAFDQIRDDVVYFEDNFGGIGFLVRDVDRRVLTGFGEALMQLKPLRHGETC